MVIRVKQGVVGIRRHPRLGGRRALVGGVDGRSSRVARGAETGSGRCVLAGLRGRAARGGGRPPPGLRPVSHPRPPVASFPVDLGTPIVGGGKRPCVGS